MTRRQQKSNSITKRARETDVDSDASETASQTSILDPQVQALMEGMVTKFAEVLRGQTITSNMSSQQPTPNPNEYDLKREVPYADIPTTTPLTDSSTFTQYIIWENFMLKNIMEFVVPNKEKAKLIWQRKVPISRRLFDFLESLIYKNLAENLSDTIQELNCTNIFEALMQYRDYHTNSHVRIMEIWNQIHMPLEEIKFEDMFITDYRLITSLFTEAGVVLTEELKDKLRYAAAFRIAAKYFPESRSYLTGARKKTGEELYTDLLNILKRPRRTFQNNNYNNVKTQEDKQSSVNRSNIVICERCGKEHHWFRKVHCPAYSHRCTKCNILGHFEDRCQRSFNNQQVTPSLQSSDRQASVFQSYVDINRQQTTQSIMFPAAVYTSIKVQKQPGAFTALIDTGADTCIAFDPRILVNKYPVDAIATGIGTTKVTHEGVLRFTLGGCVIEDRLALEAIPVESCDIDLLLSVPRLASLHMISTEVKPTSEVIGIDRAGQLIYKTQQTLKIANSIIALPLHPTNGASGLFLCYIPYSAFDHLINPTALPVLRGLADSERLTLAHRRIHKPLEVCKEILKDTNIESHCPHCLDGHNSADSTHSLALVPATQPGQKVHFDCFKTGVTELPNAYLFIDAYTKFKQVYFTERRRVLDVKLCVDKWLSFTSKLFKTMEFIADQAIENEALKTILQEDHILLRTRSSYSSELNGIAERSIRTVIEDAGTLFAASGLPETAIPYVVKAAVYLTNILPATHKAPAELLNLPRPFGLLRVIGCRAYIHNFKRRKSIAESRVSLGYLVGYAFEEYHIGCYFIWRPDTGRIIATRHVVFDERRTFKDDLAHMHSFTDPWFDAPEYDEDPPTDDNWFNSIEPIESVPSSVEASAMISQITGNCCARTYLAKPLKFIYNPVSIETPAAHLNLLPYMIQLANCAWAFPSHITKIEDEDSLIDQLQQTQGSVNISFPDPPKTWSQMIASDDALEWKQATEKEWLSLLGQRTFTIVEKSDLPNDAVVLRPIWLWTRKRDGSYKARLVADGSKQDESIWHYAPTVPVSIIHLFLALTASRYHDIIQLDISTAFLHAGLKETNIYLHFPPGYKQHNKLLHLHKCLYGLRQAPHQWAQLLFSRLTTLGWTQSAYTQCLFHRQNALLICYVDDMLISGESAVIKEFADAILQQFPGKISDVIDEQGTDFLSMRIRKINGDFCVDQEDYIRTRLSKFFEGPIHGKHTPMLLSASYDGDTDPSLIGPYLELLGILLFVSTRTRYDIAYAVGFFATFNTRPTSAAFQALKRVARYLYGTATKCLRFVGGASITLDGFSDCGSPDADSARWTSGGIIRCAGTPVHWYSQRQQLTVLSTCEGELVALCTLVRHLLWLRWIFLEITRLSNICCPVYCDNQSTILIGSTSLCKMSRTQHLHRRYRFMQQHVHRREISITYCPTKIQLADLLTKPLAKEQHQRLCHLIETGYSPSSVTQEVTSLATIAHFILSTPFNHPDCPGFRKFT
jgi:hypothetical protein